MGDRHRGVVNDHHKVVEGISNLVGWSSACDHHVAAKVGTPPAHGTAHKIGPANFSLVVNAEADDGFTPLCLKRCFLFRREMAVAVVVARCLIGGFLGLTHRFQFLFVGVAAVGQALIQQGLDGGAMLFDLFALDNGLFIPINAEPLKPFQDVLRELRFRPFLIGVFDS